MALLGRPYPIFYLARNAASGLINITAKIKRPNGTYYGPVSLTEHIEPGFEGSYFYNYYTNESTDLEGEYLIILNDNDHKSISRVSFEKLQSGPGVTGGISVIRKKGLDAKVSSKQYLEVLAGSTSINISAEVGNKSYDAEILKDQLDAFLHANLITGDIL